MSAQNILSRCLVVSTTLLLTGALSACSTMDYLASKQDLIRNRDNAYLSSQTAAPLQMPSGVNGSQIGDSYPLPAVDAVAPNAAVSQVPPGSAAARHTPAASTQPAGANADDNAPSVTGPVTTQLTKTGAQSALVVDANINPVWDMLKSTLSDLGYHVLTENPQTGVIYLSNFAPTTTNAMTLYQLHVTALTPTQTQLTFTDNKGQPLSQEVSERMLTQLQQAISRSETTSAQPDRSMWQRVKGWF